MSSVMSNYSLAVSGDSVNGADQRQPAEHPESLQRYLAGADGPVTERLVGPPEPGAGRPTSDGLPASEQPPAAATDTGNGSSSTGRSSSRSGSVSVDSVVTEPEQEGPLQHHD